MSDHSDQGVPQSEVIRLLKEKPEGVSAEALINELHDKGLELNAVIRTVRRMLDKGAVELGPEMNIRLLRQPA